MPVQVSDSFLAKIFKAVESDHHTEVKVDLENQTITLISEKESEKFDVNVYKKECLLKGYDDIEYLMSLKDKIESYEESHT